MSHARIHPEAAEEAAASALRYEQIDPELGARFRAEVEAAVVKAISAPELFRRRTGDYRQSRVAGFPFAVVFRILPRGDIEIPAIMHLHRRPGYWLERTD